MRQPHFLYEKGTTQERDASLNTEDRSMNANMKIALLERRLKSLITNDKDNQGVQRKIYREIQKLKKGMEQEGLQNAGDSLV